MSVVYMIAIGMLVIAGLIAVWRIVVGPSNVDRILANDIIVVVVICGIAVTLTATGSGSALPILLVLALVGFVGAVSVARFLVIREGRKQR